jgi:hypothetical protein
MNRRRKRAIKKASWTKIRLRLPDLDQAKGAVLSSLRSPESQRGYQHAIDEFIAWYCSEPRLSFNRSLSPGTGFTSSLVCWHQELSTSDSRPCAGWRTKRPIPDF